jgi:hypothetical protein
MAWDQIVIVLDFERRGLFWRIELSRGRVTGRSKTLGPSISSTRTSTVTRKTTAGMFPTGGPNRGSAAFWPDKINRPDKRSALEMCSVVREPRPTKQGYPPSAVRIFAPSGLPRPVVGSQPGPALNAPLFPETISRSADGF